jgi:hypothetical protein
LDLTKVDLKFTKFIYNLSFPRALFELEIKDTSDLWKLGKPTSIDDRTQYVRFILGENSMTFEGIEIKREDIPSVLAKVADRSNTVLTFNTSTSGPTLEPEGKISGYLWYLSKDLGFKDFEYSIRHPLGAYGTNENNPYHD